MIRLRLTQSDSTLVLNYYCRRGQSKLTCITTVSYQIGFCLVTRGSGSAKRRRLNAFACMGSAIHYRLPTAEGQSGSSHDRVAMRLWRAESELTHETMLAASRGIPAYSDNTRPPLAAMQRAETRSLGCDNPNMRHSGQLLQLMRCDLIRILKAESHKFSDSRFKSRLILRLMCHRSATSASCYSKCEKQPTFTESYVLRHNK